MLESDKLIINEYNNIIAAQQPKTFFTTYKQKLWVVLTDLQCISTWFIYINIIISYNVPITNY